MKEPMREHFTFFASFYDALSDLGDAERLACYDAICQFALTGKEPKVEGIVSTVFKLIKPVLDKSKVRAEAGKEGGKNKQNESKTKANAKQKESKTKATAKQTARDKEYGVGVVVGVGEGSGSVVDVECSVAHTREDNTAHTDSNSDPSRIPDPTMIAIENQEKGYGLSADSLHDFFEYNSDRGWKMNWKTALRKWAEREKDRQRNDQARSPAGNFGNFPQRSDPEHKDLVQQLIAAQN